MPSVEIIEKPILGSTYMTYKAFKQVPIDLLITEDTPIGSTICVAGFPKNAKLILRKYHKPATDSFPSGGLTLYNPAAQVLYSCYLDAAMVHPSNKKKSRSSTLPRNIANFFE